MPNLLNIYNKTSVEININIDNINLLVFIKTLPIVIAWGIGSAVGELPPYLLSKYSKEEYNSFYGKGTYVRYENLLHDIILNIKEVYNYIVILYRKSSNILPIIHLLQDSIPFKHEEFMNPITKFIDTTFYDSDTIDKKYKKTLYIYKVNNDFELISNGDTIPENYKYKITVNYTAIDDTKIKKSGLIQLDYSNCDNEYHKTINDFLIGFKIYRNNRDISQIGALQWNIVTPLTSMYRNKGVRINLIFNGNIDQTTAFDEDFKVSSLKCVPSVEAR